MPIYKVKLHSTNEIVEIDDSRAARDTKGNSISRYYADWHGFMMENRLGEDGIVRHVEIGIILE